MGEIDVPQKCGKNSYTKTHRPNILQKFIVIAKDLNYKMYFFQNDWRKIGVLVNIFLNMAPYGIIVKVPDPKCN